MTQQLEESYVLSLMVLTRLVVSTDTNDAAGLKLLAALSKCGTLFVAMPPKATTLALADGIFSSGLSSTPDAVDEKLCSSCSCV